jgi:hypothetical protein
MRETSVALDLLETELLTPGELLIVCWIIVPAMNEVSLLEV